ncbi:MAG: AbrB/MazE/SpoVT family DNA-binding domain-containing protein [Halorhabdus sp.]
MGEVTLDDRGRLTLPKAIRERYGDRYRIVELHDGVKLLPVEDEPLATLRAEFADVEQTAEELRAEAREGALDDVGR